MFFSSKGFRLNALIILKPTRHIFECMKTLLSFCFCFVLLTGQLMGQEYEKALTTSSESSISVFGSIRYKETTLKEFRILVYCGDSLYCFVDVQKQRIPKIYFDRNRQYIVIINKEGFYPKKIEIDGTVPELTHKSDVVKFEIDVEMTPIENFISNKFVWDIPYARIKYDLNRGKFRYVKSQIIKDNEYHFPD